MTVYMFPGQGSQFKGMGGKLFDEFPELTETADQVLGYSIRDLCLSDEKKQLNRTEFTQPALYVVNALSFHKKIHEGGARPDFLLGHSLGEYNALQAAGAISFEDGLKLVAKRGALMSEAPKGGMAAILGVSSAAVGDILQDRGLTGIDIANYNAGVQTIVSGPEVELEKAMVAFQAANATYVRLNTSGAFHSRYMAPVKEKFTEYLNAFKFSALQIPVISNVHAKPYRQLEIADNLAEQIACPVRWMESITFLLAQGETEFFELGVGSVLTKLVDQIKKQSSAIEPDGPQSSGSANRLKKTAVDLDKRIDAWNAQYPVGTKVVAENYQGELVTRTKATILFGHRAAIYMQGYQGYFDLDEVRPAS